jgi:hypothetical protein
MIVNQPALVEEEEEDMLAKLQKEIGGFNNNNELSEFDPNRFSVQHSSSIDVPLSNQHDVSF